MEQIYIALNAIVAVRRQGFGPSSEGGGRVGAPSSTLVFAKLGKVKKV